MEISSYSREDESRYGGRTLSDISIASSVNEKVQPLSSFRASKHVRDSRVKFLCSYGGKILPRPSDKRLRYVGGDTRMITVPRHILLNALRLKLAEVCGHDVTLKYQLPEEDLDALVSVSSDEDLENMMEECDRLDSMGGSLRLRVFVFSSPDQDAIDFNDVADPKVSEHRYVEAVNTIQADVSFRQSENVLSSDLHKNPSGYVGSIAGIQERFPVMSESIYSYVYPFEQLPPAGSHPFSTIPQTNNFLGHIVPPPRVAIAKVRNEPATSLPANDVSFQGPPVAFDDFLDLESGESARSSASSQQDLYHRNRCNSNSQIQSHLEHCPYHIDEHQISRAESRLQTEAKLDSDVNATCTVCNLPTSEPTCVFDVMSECKNECHEDQPLSPGALLQRQLQLDQTSFEMGTVKPFEKQSSQSSLEGSCNQFQSFHERQKIEQLPSNHLQKNQFQECELDGHSLSEPMLETLEKPVILPGAEYQATSLHPEAVLLEDLSKALQNSDVESNIVSGLQWQPFTESTLLSGLQSNIVDIDKLYELEESKQFGLLSTKTPADSTARTDLDFCSGTESSWLTPDLVSFPPTVDQQVALPDETKHPTSAVSLTDKGPVEVGLSLLDEPIDYASRVFSTAAPNSDMDPTLATIRDSSILDVMSDLLQSGPTMNSSCQPADSLVATLLEPFAKLGEDDGSLPMVTDVHSASQNRRIGSSSDADSSSQSLHQDTAAGTIDDASADVCNKNIHLDLEEGEAGSGRETGHSSFNLQGAPQSTAELLEDEQMLHLNYEQDTLESSLLIEGDLTIERSRLEFEDKDTFSSTARVPMNAAATAEAEAIARGLQTIRNSDLEELRELGSGTFGTVYHGKWRGTDVAIKWIKSSCFSGRPCERERLIADFWQEAFILGQLHHPNVVAFYGVVPDGPDGMLATVTEYMVNGSLKQALQTKDRILDRHKRLVIAMDAAFGMEYLHKKNVVHFDLKCENLLVNLRDIQRPICKVGDLGLSKVKQQTMISGSVRGTLPWMAPELLNGSSSLVSEKVDVYSFGIVLWELLTGEEPYASMHYGAIIGGIVTNTLRPLVPRRCEPAWRLLMEACWAADPSDRPTFTEIANSLRAMDATINTKGQGQAQNVE